MIPENAMTKSSSQLRDTRKLRKYQKAWFYLKKYGLIRVSLEVASTTNPAKVQQYARTFRKAIQKEKYQDDAFKREFPDATLTSEIDTAQGIVEIALHRNEQIDLDVLEDL